jgi:hypothetical protein
MLLGLACRLMPRERNEWAEAMKAEMAYLPRTAKVSWAAGCLLAALKQRFTPMHADSFRINRWVFLLEMLGCFGPATLAWWLFTFGPSGTVHVMQLENIVRDLPPSYLYTVSLHAGHTITGLVAPIGLFLGLRYVTVGRGLDNRGLGHVLIAAPILQTVAGLVGVVAFDVQPLLPGLFLLLIVLPVAGIAHLMYLGRSPAAPLAADAGLAPG